MLDVERETANGGPVAPRIFEQRLGLGYPDVLAATAQPLVEDDRGDLAALAGAGPVPEEEAGPVGTATLGWCDRETLLYGREQAGNVALEGVAGIDQRLELRVGKRLCIDDSLRQGRDVGRPRRGDRAHGDRFHQRGRVR